MGEVVDRQPVQDCHEAAPASSPCPCRCCPPLLQALMLRGEADLTQSGGRLMCLALGLLFLHRQNAVEATLEVGEWQRVWGAGWMGDLSWLHGGL